MSDLLSCAGSSSSPHGSGMEAFPDDLLLEVLSRVAAKSLCRFKCVSTHWLGLIDHPDNRKKLPQPMAGFFYTSTSGDGLAIRFFDVLGSRRRPLISPSFAFLPTHLHVDLLDGCNGLLLLCRSYRVSERDEFRYVVCNPITQQWLELPDRSQAGEVGTVRLGFDLAVSSHFHVFVLLQDDYHNVTGVDMYSSETRRWVHKASGIRHMYLGYHQSASVFLNGYLHLCTFSVMLDRRVTAVDTEGETWTKYNGPYDIFDDFIQLSQGRLHYAFYGRRWHETDADIRLQVYVMHDCDSKEWIMKHSIKASAIFEGILHVDTIRHIDLIAIHPGCNLIFFTVGENKSLVCYNIDRREAKLITDLGPVDPGNARLAYVPYVPMYSELQSLHM